MSSTLSPRNILSCGLVGAIATRLETVENFIHILIINPLDANWRGDIIDRLLVSHIYMSEANPKVLQVNVIERFMPVAELAAFIQTYRANKRSLSKSTVKPPEQYYEMAAMRKAGASLKEIAAKYDVTLNSVHSFIGRVANWEYMNN